MNSIGVVKGHFLCVDKESAFTFGENGEKIMFVPPHYENTFIALWSTKRVYRNNRVARYNDGSLAPQRVNQVAILGNEGIGKSYFMYYLMYRLLQTGRTVSVINARTQKATKLIREFHDPKYLPIYKSSNSSARAEAVSKHVFIFDSCSKTVLRESTLITRVALDSLAVFLTSDHVRTDLSFKEGENILHMTFPPPSYACAVGVSMCPRYIAGELTITNPLQTFIYHYLIGGDYRGLNHEYVRNSLSVRQDQLGELFPYLADKNAIVAQKCVYAGCKSAECP